MIAHQKQLLRISSALGFIILVLALTIEAQQDIAQQSPIRRKPISVVMSRETPSAKYMKTTSSSTELLAVFSDVDGTLVHYPTKHNIVVVNDDSATSDHNVVLPSIIPLPPTASGMLGVISAKTLVKCSQLRSSGIKFILVSGMRLSTLLSRLPYLPKADAYCCEAGGRIFYSVPGDTTSKTIQIQPLPFRGATSQDLEPFCLVEDFEWRQKVEDRRAAGKDGYIGNDIVAGDDSQPVSLEKRDGELWKFARDLIEKGIVVDIKGYSTCFRVNRKHQSSGGVFDDLVQGKIEHPPVLATSTNLGCVDFYPAFSGKMNCCRFLAQKLSGGDPFALEKRCVCICDDDNDVEMALACLHAYIPSVSSESMNETILLYPTRLTMTFSETVTDTDAAEAALDLVLDRIKAS